MKQVNITVEELGGARLEGLRMLPANTKVTPFQKTGPYGQEGAEGLKSSSEWRRAKEGGQNFLYYHGAYFEKDEADGQRKLYHVLGHRPYEGNVDGDFFLEKDFKIYREPRPKKSRSFSEEAGPLGHPMSYKEGEDYLRIGCQTIPIKNIKSLASLVKKHCHL